MSWTRNPGRVVGLWYLLLVLGGPLRLIYIPNKLFVHDNAAATAGNIAAHEWLFRFGMLSDLLGAVVLIFLVLAFYRLFKGVDQQLAVLLVIVGGVMPALINFVNVVSDAGALMRSEEHTSELQSPFLISYAVFCLKKKQQERLQAIPPTGCHIQSKRRAPARQ